MWKIEKIVSKGDYNYAKVKGHPKATKHGYVLEHRVVVENSLSRLLNPEEIVHHINGDKKDNRISNLEVMTVSDHSRHHASKGRLWVELCCPNCHVLFKREKNKTHLGKIGKATFCSRRCAGKFWTTVGRTHEMDDAISGNIVREYRKYSHDNPEETT